MTEDKQPKKAGKRKGYLPQIGVRLPREWLRELDEYAAKSGWRFNRSDFIREAIEKWLAEKRREK